MVIPHSWRECRPVLLNPSTGEPAPLWQEAALAYVWNEMSDGDRQAFHRTTCLESTTPDDMRVMARLTQTLRIVLECEN